MNQLKFVDAIGSAEITGGPYDGVCFYVGGNAYRIWPIAEVHARPERYRLPIWVRSNPQNVSAASDAGACIAALMRYGVPEGSLVALDSETSADPVWVNTFVRILNGENIVKGWPVIDYGSQSSVFGNQNPDGYYWGADWTNVPHLHSGDGMTQYISLQNEDLSLASSALPLWDTRPPIPTPKPIIQEIDMLILRTTSPSGTKTFIWDGGSNVTHVVDPKDEAAFEAAGLKVVDISEAQLDAIAGIVP